MDPKKFFKALLYPHFSVLLILTPVAVALLVYTFSSQKQESVFAYISYVLSAYTLTVVCLRIPDIIQSLKTFRTENRYVKRWFDDFYFRKKIMLLASFIWNTAYALLQTGLGFTHKSFWFFSLAVYDITLSVMRLSLFRHTSRYKPGENMSSELKKFRNCGFIFLVMNLALSLMIFFMVYWNRTFHHNEITTIALAAYTFTSLTVAIVNVSRKRHSDNPVFSASQAIALASACVSILTLESTMLTTFGDGSLTLADRRILLGVSGAAISFFIIGMSIHMIIYSNKRIKQFVHKKEEM